MPSDPRAVLLNALDTLDRIKDEHGEPVRVYLAVAYCVETDDSHYDGVVRTEDPGWLTLALLNRAYEAIERNLEAASEPDEE